MSEKKANDTNTLGRRKFLLGVGAGAAAAGAAVIATRKHDSVQTVATNPANDKTSSKGYEVSAHIQNYYRTLKV